MEKLHVAESDLRWRHRNSALRDQRHQRRISRPLIYKLQDALDALAPTLPPASEATLDEHFPDDIENDNDQP